MFKRLCLPILLILLPIGFAQTPPTGPEGPPNLAPDQIPPVEVLKHFFDFDETQSTQFDALLESRGASIAPIQEQMRAIGQALRDVLASENPDPTGVGELVLQERDFRDQIQDTEMNFLEGFLSMLNEEQQQRYNGLVRAERVIPVIGAAKQIRLPLIPPEPPPAE